MKIARNTKAILKEAGELKSDGRPKGSKNKEQKRREIIQQWRKDHPYMSVKESLVALNEVAAAIDPELKISRATAYRYWKIGEAEE